ncbi:MarR family transcriptional regulator [Actinoplanes sp. KI2]|uniref:MarR family winged helix-turn-helix transcriptional regulator n=1 Tax=Actinoplanes sp. KI2 TaxID=2983315 RepID=UPI0021D5C820|nr:MarR family transcriptional regulator [Actinoplanes sp. KI2]MCU7730874.1 MarR family transcriptional regulator [Actinoplanes sp. KI2]
MTRSTSTHAPGLSTTPPPTALSPAEDEVVGALIALSRVFVAETARSLSTLDEDVTLPQFRTLVVLVSRGPQRVVDLAQELAVTSSTAVRMCNRLVRKGLVVRAERPDDRRVAWITLTTAGRQLVGEATRRRRELIAELIAGLSLTRPLVFASVLNAIVEAAGEVPDAEWWQRWRDMEVSPASNPPPSASASA